KKAAPEEVSERARCTKGKEAKREAVEPPARPFTVRELCKVNDQARKDKFFIVQIFDLLGHEAEGPLRVRWSNLIASSRVWTDGSLAARGVAPVPHEATLHSFQRADGPSRQSIAALGDSEQRCKDLELAIDIICGELKEIQDSRHRLEDEVLKLAQEVLRSEL
ncbi:hypothetical protein GW17_00058550, partial [Ensete ventricosum]